MDAMSHVATSKILEEIIIEFRKKGLTIPENVMSDLKSARVLMKVMDASQKDRGETAPKIDEYFGSVEAYLVTEAGKYFPPEKVDGWLKKLDLASCDSCITVEEAEEESRFIPSVPRDQKWIRVEPITSLPIEKLKQLATETNLSFRTEKDGHLLVYGTAEAIKEFIKKMTTQTGQTSS
jgi:hypothetical protein